MLSSANSLAAKPAVLPAQPMLAASPPSPGSAGTPSFAQLLHQPPDTTAAPPPAESKSKSDNNADADAPRGAPAPSPTRRPFAQATPAKPTTPAPNRPAEAAPAKAQRADDVTTTGPAAGSYEEPATAGLNEFAQLIGLATPPHALPAPAAASGLPVTGTDDGDHALPAAPGSQATEDGPRLTGIGKDAGTDARAGKGTDDAARDRRAAEAQRGRGIDLAAATDSAAGRSTANDALPAAASTAASGAPRAASATDTAMPGFAALLAQALPAVHAGAEAAPVSASGHVQAPLQSSAFAPELGARVSLLAVDGVQLAELQLNPADMGPVSVQITVDGAQAHVSFHAAEAETRQALEQSLPELAAALQGQGLTLSGGGVFQQTPRDTRGGDAEAGDAERRGAGASAGTGRNDAAAAAVAPARRSVGLLDTFA